MRPGRCEVGGLQLECPVCAGDLFSQQTVVLAHPYRSVHRYEVHGAVAMTAVACDRCGNVQLFDPSARSCPEAPVPPRRRARLRRRPVEVPPDEIPTWEEPAVAAADEPVDEVEEVEEAEGMPWEEPVQAGGGDSTDDLVDDQLTSWPMPLPPLPPLPPLGEHDGPPP